MSDRIRVLRLIARLNIGGPALHVAALTTGLDPARYDSRLVTGLPGPREGDMSDLLPVGGPQPVVVPQMGREVSLLADAITLGKLVGFMRLFRPHVVHTHTAKAGAVGRLAARLTRVPVVVHTFHGHVFHDYFGRLKSRLAISTERMLARLSDRLITLSERLRGEIAGYGVAPLEKIEVIPLGLDLQRFSVDCRPKPGVLRQALGLGQGDVLIGSVGRLVPIKNHRLFLQAASAVRAAGLKAKFVIVGDGELRSALETEAHNLGLNGDVYFTGWRRDLPEVYADLDVLVNTSLNEGTPVAVIEAMAAGVPVVATNVGGVPDVILHGLTGTLIPSQDCAALVCALENRLSRPDDSRRMAEAAGQEALRRYSRQQLVASVDGLYQRLLADKRIQ
jgi:glycosyltransferase involved in cell wall biosynthesis